MSSNSNYHDVLLANCSSAMNDDPDHVIGGGTINEKKRTFFDKRKEGRNMQADEASCSLSSKSVFHGTRNQAHFLQAMEGLDRYPNYLAKWTEDDAEELEQALVQRLEKVRQQRQAAKSQQGRLQQVIENLCQRDPTLKRFLQPPQTWDEVRESGILDNRTNRAIFRSKWFRPSPNHTVPTLAEVLKGGPASPVELDAGYLEEIMEEEMTDVYSFPLLSECFCAKLQSYTRMIIEEIENSKDPDFMVGGQRRVRNLDTLGLGWLNDLLFHVVVRPISRQLYQETEIGDDGENDIGDLDWRHGFIAAYASNPNERQPRQRLVPHTDDAEVTLNVCIGDAFDGGNLKFWGLRGTDLSGGVVGEYTPKPGRALLHAGRQLHEVTEVTKGDRFALIMWTRSWSGIRSMRCPCCWLNRRGSNDDGQSSTKSCICSARWN